MRDVAALAGVALKTVSRVVNGVPTVDPILHARVTRAIEKLGYRPNLAANLRGGRSNVIGLLLEDIGNPFSSALHRAIEDHARTRGVLVLAASLNEDPDREHTLVQRLIDQRVDGLIVMPAGDDHRYLVAEQDHGVRFVFVDRSPRPLLGDAVICDNEPGAMNAVSHLVDHGHRRIGYLGDDLKIATVRQRFAGFTAAATACGLVADEGLVVHGLRSIADARAAALQMFEVGRPPEALFTSQNLVTLGAVAALHELGLERTVAMVGFDDVSMADVVRPGITVMAQDTDEMGALAARLLFARIDGEDQPPREYIVPTTMLRRGSGEIVRPAS